MFIHIETKIERQFGWVVMWFEVGERVDLRVNVA